MRSRRAPVVQVLDEPLEQRAMRADTPDPVERSEAAGTVLAPDDPADRGNHTILFIEIGGNGWRAREISVESSC